MSGGYQVTNPDRFLISNPINLIKSQTNLNSAQIVIPEVGQEYVEGDITADQMLSGYVLVGPSAPGSANVDTAANILAALKLKIAALYGLPAFKIPNGTRFSFVVYYKGDPNNIFYVNDNPSGGVEYDWGAGPVFGTSSSIFDVVVDQQLELDDETDHLTIINRDYDYGTNY